MQGQGQTQTTEGISQVTGWMRFWNFLSCGWCYAKEITDEEQRTQMVVSEEEEGLESSRKNDERSEIASRAQIPEDVEPEVVETVTGEHGIQDRHSDEPLQVVEDVRDEERQEPETNFTNNNARRLRRQEGFVGNALDNKLRHLREKQGDYVQVVRGLIGLKADEQMPRNIAKYLKDLEMQSSKILTDSMTQTVYNALGTPGYFGTRFGRKNAVEESGARNFVDEIPVEEEVVDQVSSEELRGFRGALKTWMKDLKDARKSFMEVVADSTESVENSSVLKSIHSTFDKIEGEVGGILMKEFKAEAIDQMGKPIWGFGAFGGKKTKEAQQKSCLPLKSMCSGRKPREEEPGFDGPVPDTAPSRDGVPDDGVSDHISKKSRRLCSPSSWCGRSKSGGHGVTSPVVGPHTSEQLGRAAEVAAGVASVIG